MNWNDLSKAWRSQPAPAMDAGVLVALEKEFAHRQAKLARQLFWRDIREATAGVLVAAVFARVGWTMGAHGWPISVAVLLMLGLSGYFVRERVRTRRAAPGPEAALLERVETEIAEVRRQRDLLGSVLRWYLAPCLAAAAILVTTVLVYAPVPAGIKFAVAAAAAAICGLVGWAVVVLNHRAVARELAPRLQELEELRKQLANFQ